MKHTMKTLLSVLIALALSLSICTTALAAVPAMIEVDQLVNNLIYLSFAYKDAYQETHNYDDLEIARNLQEAAENLNQIYDAYYRGESTAEQLEDAYNSAYNIYNTYKDGPSSGPVDPTATPPSGLTATYGDTLGSVALSNPSGNTDGSWAWVDSTASVGNVGSNSFQATFTPQDQQAYNSVTVSLSVEVGPADPVANAPSGITATYGDTLDSLTLSNPEGNTDGTWEWADSTASVGDVGSHTFTANFTPSSTNYNTASADVTVTVEKADPIAVAPSGLTATYGDALSSVGLSNQDGNTDGTWEWAAEGTVGNVGSNSFTANFTPADANNYKTASADVTVTVEPKAASITPEDKSKTYGEADPTLTATVEGTVGGDTLDYTLTRVEGDGVGDYEISVILGQNPNYDVSVYTAKLTIDKKEANIAADLQIKTYGDDDPILTATVTGTVDGDSLDYSMTRAAGEDVGDYDISVILGQNPNYSVTTSGNILTIRQKAASIAAEAKTKVFGEADPKLTADVTGAADGDTLDYTLSRAEGEEVGEYAITVTLGDNPNYTVTAAGSKLTITKQTATVTANAKTKVYGEDDPALTATVTGGDIDYTLTRAAGEDVGTYAITVQLGSNPNYDVTVENSELTITKQTATVTAEAKTKAYGEADPALTATVTGGDIDYTLTREAGENAGEYAITVTLGSNPNYDVTAVGSKLTITKQAATVTAEAKTKAYGEADPALTATVTGADDIDYTLTREAGENAGEYAITVTLGSNPNYDVTAVGSKLTITKQAVIIAAEAKTKVYGEADPALTATVTGAEGVEYTLTREAGENAGEYAITVNVTENPNFDVTAVGSKLTIAKKDASITADNLSKTAGEADPKLTADVTGAVGFEQLTYLLRRDSGEEPGKYTIYVEANAKDNPNYNVSAYNGSLTINPAPEQPAPEAPEAPEVSVEATIPVSGDDASTNVTVIVENSVATIANSNIDEVLTAEQVGTVTVDMSGLETEVDEVVIPGALLAKVAEAVTDESNSADALEVKLTEGTILLDADAVAAIKEQVGDNDLHLKLETVEAEDLNEAQQAAVKEIEDEILVIYDAYMILNGQRVEILGDGKAAVTVKAPLAEGQTVEGIRVFAVDDEGNLTEMETTCENEEVKFQVETLSKYVLTYDPTKVK